MTAQKLVEQVKHVRFANIWKQSYCK